MQFARQVVCQNKKRRIQQFLSKNPHHTDTLFLKSDTLAK